MSLYPTQFQRKYPVAQFPNAYRDNAQSIPTPILLPAVFPLGPTWLFSPPMHNVQTSQLREMSLIYPAARPINMYPTSKWMPARQHHSQQQRNPTPSKATTSPHHTPASLQTQKERLPKIAVLPMSLPSEFPSSLAPAQGEILQTIIPFKTPLGKAITKNDSQEVIEILKSGRNNDWVDNGYSLITYTIKNNLVQEAVPMLISRANSEDPTLLNYVDRGNTTALMEACKKLNVDLVRLLLRTADPNITTKETNYTALHWLVSKSTTQKEGSLPISKKYEESHKIYSIVKILLRSRARLDITDCDGRTPLQAHINKLNAKEIDLLLVRLLIMYGAQSSELYRIVDGSSDINTDFNMKLMEAAYTPLRTRKQREKMQL